MGRKVFQDFAHVMCQMFIESPSNRDLVNLIILGNGRLELEIVEGRATHNGIAIEPMPFSEHWHSWALKRMSETSIDRELLVAASLTTDYEVQLNRKTGMGWLCGAFTFKVYSSVRAPDRTYTAELNSAKEWGLLCV
jgi:hypothetical protein